MTFRRGFGPIFVDAMGRAERPDSDSMVACCGRTSSVPGSGPARSVTRQKGVWTVFDLKGIRLASGCATQQGDDLKPMRPLAAVVRS
jgi:hypothetical protein